MNPNTLALLGPALLANVVSDLSAVGLTPPARRIFTHSLPVRDCDQIAVWVERIDTAQGGDTTPRPAQGPTYRPVTHVVTWGVEIALCATVTDTTPTAAQVTADGVLGATYLWAMERLLTTRWMAGTMFAPHVQQLAGGKGLTVGGQLLDAAGGLLTVTATFSVNTRDLP